MEHEVPALGRKIATKYPRSTNLYTLAAATTHIPQQLVCVVAVAAFAFASAATSAEAPVASMVETTATAPITN